MDGADAYPLDWPEGWPRCDYPEHSRFKTTFTIARDCLVDELRMLGAKYVVISTDVPLRRDGLPMAKRREPDDKGVAVYFQYRGKPMTFACDRWAKVEDNLQAIRRTIEAIRGIERWGASDMMERAFTGFLRLPSSDWRSVLGVPPDCDNLTVVKFHYRSKAQLTHPDKPGGDEAAFQAVNQAWREAQEALS